MIVRDQGDRISVDAPAKINLHLEVLGKRPDGYHELETLLVAVDLFDTLAFSRASGATLQCSDPSIANAENLVMRAVELVRQESGHAAGVAIELTKRVPVAAGLAGGSSDAAATLAALNRLWDLNWSNERLAVLAARLGSDVPFFFFTPAAIARGRGEKVTALRMGCPLHVVLVCPPERLSTAEVFRRLVPPARPASVAPIQSALEAGDVRQVANLLHNRLEEASVRLCPAVADLARRARDWDCLGSRMSGSGSCYFALCSSSDQARRLGRTLKSQDLGSVFVVQSSP